MTLANDHDPLCPSTDPTESEYCALCHCDLIAKVREDMLTKCIAALQVDDMHSLDPSWDGTNWNNAVSECIHILRALQEKP